VLTHSRGRQQVGPFNEFWFNFHFDEVQDKATGLRVSSDPFVGLWMTAAHNLEASVELHADSTLRTAADAPLLHQHYLSTQISITPATWAPLLTLSGRIGRIADVAAQRVRTGGDVHLSLATRPAARLEFEPSWDMAWAQRDGQRTYRENALQVLAVWHFDARQSLRAIVQRKGMDRLAEPGVAAARDRSTLGSLTYAWRQSAGNVLYLGLNRSAMGLGQSVRSNEAFIKLQIDVDSVRTAF
jgi:hypothetical protein